MQAIDLVAVAWLFISGVVCYVFSVVFTMIFSNIGYPPNAARLGFWLGLVVWAAFILFAWLPFIVMIHVPLVVMVVVGSIVLLFGLILLVGKRRLN
ncbi:MAG: hypothetical protein ACOX44_16910 [Limnochordia bacterium]|jgi:hypothetical protein